MVSIDSLNSNKKGATHERNYSLHDWLVSLQCFLVISIYDYIPTQHSMAFLCFWTQSSGPWMFWATSKGSQFLGVCYAGLWGGYVSLHSSVTSQPKTIGHFTLHSLSKTNWIWFWSLHSLLFTCRFVLPQGFDLCCEFDFFYRSRSNKNCDVVWNW